MHGRCTHTIVLDRGVGRLRDPHGLVWGEGQRRAASRYRRIRIGGNDGVAADLNAERMSNLGRRREGREEG